MRRRFMFKVGVVLCLMVVAVLLPVGNVLAAETPESVPPLESAGWERLVYVIVTALVGTVALPYLTRKAQAAKQEVEKLRAEGLSNGVQARHILVADLKRFLIDYCSTLLELRLPEFLPRILSAKMTGVQIKDELRAWGTEAKDAAQEYFTCQGLDIAALIGDHYLDQAVRWAADHVSPFPGKETAVQLAEKKYTNWIIEKGVDYVRNQWANGGTPEKPVTTPSE